MRVNLHMAAHGDFRGPNVGRMPFTREDSRRYAEANIERICAEQGITVAITDPETIALTISLLRIGKQRHDALRVEEPPARPARRKNTNPRQVRAE